MKSYSFNYGHGKDFNLKERLKNLKLKRKPFSQCCISSENKLNS